MWQLLKWMLLSHLFVFTLSSQAMADKLSDAKLLDWLPSAKLILRVILRKQIK